MYELWTKSTITKAEVLYDKLCTLYYKDYTGNKLNSAARGVSESIHHTGSVFSGWVSMSGIDTKITNPKFSFTDEHFHSRQASGYLLINHFKNNIPSFVEFVEILGPLRLTHKTTKKENKELEKFQRSADYPTWQEQYKAADITLVYVGTAHALTTKYLTPFVKNPYLLKPII